jgi:hypothetical protein
MDMEKEKTVKNGSVIVIRETKGFEGIKDKLFAKAEKMGIKPNRLANMILHKYLNTPHK